MSRLIIDTPITEITSDFSHLVRLDSDFVREITDGDNSPQFVVVEIPEGRSGNNFLYDRDNLTDICEQINQNNPVGYLGHEHFDKDKKDSFLPEPQAIWLGATVANEGGKSKLVAKGYLYPWAKIREYLKRKAVTSVSWSADASAEYLPDGGYRPKKIKLESLDFSRKLREGVKGQRLMVVTEMEGSNSEEEDKVGDGLDSATIIGRLVYADLQANNPALVKTIKEMQKSEDDQEKVNAVAAKEEEVKANFETKIANLPEVSTLQKIRAALKLPDDMDISNIPGFIAALMEKFEGVSKAAVKSWFENEVLAEKVTDERARKIVARLVSVTEMEGDWLDDKGIEKIKREATTRLEDVLENDPDVKVVITEMAGSRGGARLGGTRERAQDGSSREDSGKATTKSSRFFEEHEMALGV